MAYEELTPINSIDKALPPGDARDNGSRDVPHRRGSGFDELIGPLNRNS
jgi:hypothetical protein